MSTFLIRIFSVLLLAFTGVIAQAENLATPCQFPEKSLALDGGTLKYMSVGTGKPVLLLHGLFAQKEQWSDFACELSKSGFAVYAPDLPGYGNSTGFPIEDYQLEREVVLIHQFAQILKLKPIHIAGNSMGGAIAALYSAQYPSEVRSLGFIGGPLGIAPWSKQVRAAIISGVNPFIPIDAEQFNLEMHLLFANPPALPEAVVQQAIKPYIDNNRHYQQVWDIVNLYPNVLSTARKSNKPTFAVWGVEDGIFNVSGKPLLDQKFPNSVSLAIPNASHLIMLEQPVEIAQRYKEFIASRAK